jgi:hypothetical protein
MLVRPRNGGVDDQVLEIGNSINASKSRRQTPLLCPSAEALEHAVPVAKLVGQIAPWRSGAGHPKHSIHKQTIVLAVPPFVSFLAGNKRFDSPPVRVAKCPRIKIALLSCDLESHSRVGGNP